MEQQELRTERPVRRIEGDFTDRAEKLYLAKQPLKAKQAQQQSPEWAELKAKASFIYVNKCRRCAQLHEQKSDSEHKLPFLPAKSSTWPLQSSTKQLTVLREQKIKTH